MDRPKIISSLEELESKKKVIERRYKQWVSIKYLIECRQSLRKMEADLWEKHFLT